MPPADQNYLAPIAAPSTPNRNWDQGILEPQRPAWKPTSGNALAMPQHTVKSVVKSVSAQPPLGGKGRGQLLKERMKELPVMGLVAVSQYTGEAEAKKKESARKPDFPTKEELATKKRLEE